MEQVESFHRDSNIMPMRLKMKVCLVSNNCIPFLVLQTLATICLLCIFVVVVVVDGGVFFVHYSHIYLYDIPYICRHAFPQGSNVDFRISSNRSPVSLLASFCRLSVIMACDFLKSSVNIYKKCTFDRKHFKWAMIASFYHILFRLCFPALRKRFRTLTLTSFARCSPKSIRTMIIL